MARPSRCRRVCTEPAYDGFMPIGIPCGEIMILTVDEYEVIRLIDLEKLTHEQCGQQMDISRTTVTEIYESARAKIADSIVYGKPLRIAGGHYRLCDGSVSCCQKTCAKTGRTALEQPVQQKGANQMRIAVTYENGNVFQHFGHTSQFKIYDIENGQVVNQQIVDTNGQGHGALAGFLADAKVDVLICGGIGGGAQAALREAGIRLFGGVSGSADSAVSAYLADALQFDANVHCNHHEHDHSCGQLPCLDETLGCPGTTGGCNYGGFVLHTLKKGAGANAAHLHRPRLPHGVFSL